MIKAVIFDVDGTLIDSVDEHARAWVEAFARFGRHIEYAAMRRQIGKGGDQLMKEFLTREEIEEFGERLEKDRKAHFQREHLPVVQGFPDVRDLFLRILADGKQIALASSAAGDELKTYKRKAHIEDLVQEETSKDDADQSKPQPDIFEAALKKLGDLAPSEAVIIGDSPWDAIAARRAGVPIIGVLCGGFPEAELRGAGCIAIYRDPSDLLARYDSLFDGK